MKFFSKIKDHTFVFFRRLKYTCGNLSVHGPSFLVRNDIPIFYRFVYFIVYIQVWIVAVAAILKYFDHYQQNTIRFTSRTDYLDWNTTFPSITLCEIENSDKINMLNQHMAETQGLDGFVGEIAFFTGTCYSCASTCENEPRCTIDFKKLLHYFRTTCKNLFVSCKWNSIDINCCKYFQPLQTEYGVCYSFNNNQAKHIQEKFIVATNIGQKGVLEVNITQDYEAFLHSSDDVPFWNMEYDRRLTIVYGSQATVTFSVLDVVNEPGVRIISPEIRQCRFPDELPENYKAFKFYSYSTCIVQCRIEAQLQLCNCTSHLSPKIYSQRYCDLEGIKCLTENHKTLRKLKIPDTNDTGIDCNCLPSCTESDYDVVSKKLDEPEKDLRAGSAVFVLGNRPNQRITRQVARTKLDLVVATGNVFGLCFGGSLLTIVEIVYYLFLRRWKFEEKKINVQK